MKTKASGSLIDAKGDTAMIQFLEIFGDVMRIATFQWYGEKRPQAGRREQGPTSPTRWVSPADRRTFHR
ncbi:hypothetical protein GCM10007880_53500 [Mesorhizobium amorphae]|uniref:Uncharacterized protein n=2 Tax=Phyllobacteriaceae TaxID=69277 RepID=G6Y854_9HYPH|nr:hypothetical protein A6B35_20865 [Mesorhizobium amorphae CCNWGS0123]EHH12092.1 hypothetical protein MEA186_10604 [Mesorhizobium amorphae CCNWGS0123]OWK20212.1 hypothetical protein AJ88_34480 [Mesorhizobium amorphae CCBAU 01583]GLR44833.1 hypothetical protein GCM10007880_53500 [Mesorhizobium amorphae]